MNIKFTPIKLVLAFTLFILCVFASNNVFAQGTPITLKSSWVGQYDYKMIGGNNTTAEGTSTCVAGSGVILASSSSTLSIPAGSTVVEARLYWSGSGPLDNSVVLNGTTVNAGWAATDAFNFGTSCFTATNCTWFACYADVTSLVQTTGNAAYTVTGLTANGGQPWYKVGAWDAGWSIAVVYSNPAITTRNSIQIFDGYVSTRNTTQTFTINYPSVVGASEASVLAWEGDNFLANDNFSINGVPLGGTNVFNGTSNWLGLTGAASNPNMDMDFFNVSSAIPVGSTSSNVSLSSGTDYVGVQTIILKSVVCTPPSAPTATAANPATVYCSAQNTTLSASGIYHSA